jgi:hypothetical protein
MEKQTFALVKVLKQFRVYILNSEIVAEVLYPVVKVASQQDPVGKRCKWIKILWEYDLQIQPTKSVKGQGLAQLMTKSDLQIFEQQNQINQIGAAIDELRNQPWYQGISYFFEHLSCPDHLNKNQHRGLRLQFVKYCFIHGELGWKNYYGVILRRDSRGSREHYRAVA